MRRSLVLPGLILAIRDFIAEGKARKIAAGLPWFEVRIGLHTGPVVAGKINLSEATWQLVKDRFQGEYRGEIEVKGKGKMKMYFVEPGGT